MNKRLTSLIHKYNQLFVLWMVLGGISAFFYPGIFLAMKDGMELFFVLTMFGIGLVLDPTAFIHILKKPWIITPGYLAGKTARLDLLKRRAPAIEIGMQNAGLGSVLALKHFSEQRLFRRHCLFLSVS